MPVFVCVPAFFVCSFLTLKVGSTQNISTNGTVIFAKTAFFRNYSIICLPHTPSIALKP